MIQGTVKLAAAAIGLVTLVLAACLGPSRGEPPTAPAGESVSAARLAGWLEGRGAGRWAKGIALVGTHPMVTTAQAGRVRVLAPVGGRSEPAAADSALVTWLYGALPRTTVVCVPLAAGSGAGDVARAVRLALSADPAVIVLRADLVLGAPAGESPALNEVLADCWRADSLALTVIGPSEQPPSLIGVLTVRVAETRESRQVEGGEPVELVLPRERLEGGALDPGGGNAARAGTGYLLLSLAAMPVEGSPALLERAARVGLTGPLRRWPGAGGSVFREVDVPAAFDPGRTWFDLGGKRFKWEERVGELDLSRMVPTPKGRNTVPDNARRVLTGPFGWVKVRWLAAVALLADARVMLFAPSKSQGVFSLEPGPRHVGDDPIKFLRGLLGTLTQPGSSPIFNVVAP